ncbi:MAG: SHOCT domain-containing protein [Theionarchaea archaeon]|nr:SHOCT domain-containing protein [Theionarchaea archaeon]
MILEYNESIRNGTLFPTPYMVAYSRHLEGQATKWTNRIVETELENHPVVYVANGSHASYFTNQYGLDNAERGFRISYATLYLIDIEDNIWLKGIKGRWGGDSPISIEGKDYGGSPKGPYYQSLKWDFPVKWAMSLLNSTEFHLGSPAHMLITDKNGRNIGFLGDKFINEIPDAYALISDEYEYYHLPLGDYSIVITAFDDGEIDFDVIVNRNGEATYVSYREKSVTHSTKAYSDLTGGEKYELRIDEDGDGSIDKIIAPDEVSEFKNMKELYSYLPYIFFFLVIIIGAIMIYRTRTGRIGREVEFETELRRKLQTKFADGMLTQKEYTQKLKDLGLDQKIVHSEKHEKPKTYSISEIAVKLDEKIEKGEISKEDYLQKMEDLKLIPINDTQKRLLNKYKNGEIDEKEYLRKKRDLEGGLKDAENT